MTDVTIPPSDPVAPAPADPVTPAPADRAAASPTPVPEPPASVPKPSKGVAISNWLVGRTTGLLAARTSRRSFMVRAAMAGSAVAVAGCRPATRPGGSYDHIANCPSGSACRDGYTEFCCTINNGVNACPPGSFAGGWWRADYSVYCGGTRYYIDCMQNCCGPRRGGQWCNGCVECTCGPTCNQRRIYCNYFRYGQCHREIYYSGPIACRVATCAPPWQTDAACSPAALVDNRTASHNAPCLHGSGGAGYPRRWSSPQGSPLLAPQGTCAALPRLRMPAGSKPVPCAVRARYGGSCRRSLPSERERSGRRAL